MSDTAVTNTISDKTFIKGKDSDLESTIETMQAKLAELGIEVEEVSSLNPVPNVYSVHIRDKDCELMFTNGKGATEKASLASALGEYSVRTSSTIPTRWPEWGPSRSTLSFRRPVLDAR